MQNMKVKRAIIVGASSGIGAELALTLAREGYQLVLLARREEKLKTLCQRIRSEIREGLARFIVHDVTDFDSVPMDFLQAIELLGGLDLIVFNSGVLIPTGKHEFNFSKDMEVMQTNILGAMAWLNQAAAYFQSQGSGQIVGISSVGGERGRSGAPAYNTSKAAFNTYLESLRNRLSRYGVHILTVKPGFISTDMLQNAGASFWVAPVETAVSDIWRGIRQRRQEIYTPGRWRWIAWFLRHAPSSLMRRMAV